MGLLDDLEKEAERQRAEEARLAAERGRRERIWNEQLRPAMQALDDYLQRLTRHLAFLKKRPRTVYALPGYGEVVAHIEPNWVLQSTPDVSSYEIVLEGLATVDTAACPQIVCDSVARVRSVSTALQQARLTGMSDARKNPNGEVLVATFQAKGRVQLHVHIQADHDSGQARMTFQNVEGLGGMTSRSFRAEDLNEPLFDAMARFITREELRFAQEAVNEDVRRQLQSRIQRDQIKRQWEQKLSRQLADDEASVVASLDGASRPGGLLGRLRLMSRRLVGR